MGRGRGREGKPRISLGSFPLPGPEESSKDSGAARSFGRRIKAAGRAGTRIISRSIFRVGSRSSFTVASFGAMRVTHLHSRAWSLASLSLSLSLASPFSLPDEKNLPQFISPAIKVFKESENARSKPEKKRERKRRGRIDDKIEKDGEFTRHLEHL